MRVDDNWFATLSDGCVLNSNACKFISVSTFGHLELAAGLDDYILGTNALRAYVGEFRPLTDAQAVEIADFMLERWTAYRALHAK